MKKIFTILALLLVVAQSAFAQPTLDGDCSDSFYGSAVATANSNNGFGDDNDLGALKFKSFNSEKLYVCITGEITGWNTMLVFFDFSEYGGVAAGTALPRTHAMGVSDAHYVLRRMAGKCVGCGSDVTGTILGGGEADFVLVGMEENTSTKFQIDGLRYGTNTILNTGALGDAKQDGSVNDCASTPWGGTGIIKCAYKNTFAVDVNKGLELEIPYTALPGVTSAGNVKIFVAITNNDQDGNGIYFSDEFLPGNGGAPKVAANWGKNPGMGGQSLFSSTAPLPIALTSLSNQVNGNDAAINWTVASESNISRYEVEQNVNNAWKSVAQVSAANLGNYTAEVKGLAAGLHNFRLVAVEKDGSRNVYGNTTVLVEVPGTHVVNAAYPNPFASTATLEFAVAKTQNVTIEIFNVLGQKVAVAFEGVVDANTTKAVALNAETLQSGTYFVRISGEGFVETQRINVVK